MATCPKCRIRITTPLKTWTAIDEPDKKGQKVEHLVGIYECTKCGTRFPYVPGKQKFRIVKVKEWTNLEKMLSETQQKACELRTRIEELERTKARLTHGIKTVGEKLVITELQGKMNSLEAEVLRLKEGKGVLEEEISILTLPEKHSWLIDGLEHAKEVEELVSK